MNYITDPQEIERRSMEIIAPYLENLQITPSERAIYSRLIHASGDPELAAKIVIHPNAVAAGKKALTGGANIYTDVEMVRSGVNKKKLAAWGGEAHCLIGSAKTAERAKADGITRSMAAMRIFGEKLNGAVVAIGNAPTALYEVLRLIEEENVRPALIVGIPVGFVGAAESKDALVQNGKVPFITVTGNKGGSPLAAAAINAVMYME